MGRKRKKGGWGCEATLTRDLLVLHKLVGNAHISPLPFCQFMQWWRREETACYVMTTFFQKQSLCDKVATITNFVWINYRLLIKFSILTQKFNL